MGRKRFHRYVGRRDADQKEEDVDRIYDACMDALVLHDEAYVDFDVLQGQVANYVEAVAFAEAEVDELTQEIEAAYRVTDTGSPSPEVSSRDCKSPRRYIVIEFTHRVDTMEGPAPLGCAGLASIESARGAGTMKYPICWSGCEQGDD